MMARILRLVDAPWKLYPVGVLFGLGFDTATKVALLAMSATSALSGMPVSNILVLPVFSQLEENEAEL
jgi:high-affinity nickel-transport protein